MASRGDEKQDSHSLGRHAAANTIPPLAGRSLRGGSVPYPLSSRATLDSRSPCSIAHPPPARRGKRRRSGDPARDSLAFSDRGPPRTPREGDGLPLARGAGTGAQEREGHSFRASRSSPATRTLSSRGLSLARFRRGLHLDVGLASGSPRIARIDLRTGRALGLLSRSRLLCGGDPAAVPPPPQPHLSRRLHHPDDRSGQCFT